MALASDGRTAGPADLPEGTVTFLFTDIEGSTRLLLKLGDAYRRLLEEHTTILRGAIADAGGVVVSTDGDAVFAVFARADDAVAAGIDAQRRLASHPWPALSSVRVRMGLHTGTGTRGGDNYVGLDVHRAARIANAGHGGQILISEETARAATGMATSGAALRDLGLHRLKDLPEPEHLFQVHVPDLPGDFPPPRSLDMRPHNLPSELSEFIGRRDDIAAVEELLEGSRLVNLVGPGGSGKTRLGLRVAANVLPRFADGVTFVPLWSVDDPGLLVAAIAARVGVGEGDGQLVADRLAAHLSTREMLLVLDNFEHLLPAAPTVGRLLDAAPLLKILVTSRSRLRIGGERIFTVRPLPLPDLGRADGAELRLNDAARLFIARAQALDPSFDPDERDLAAIAEIVSALDGLPLAIEIAAARTRLFTPRELLDRIRAGPDVIRGDRSDVPDHHRTLTDSIAWSYGLLTEADKAVLRRVAVFASGFALDAAEAVAAGPPAGDVATSIANLLDGSMLQQLVIAGERRFTMLRTVRDFARARSRESGEHAEVERRHAAYLADLAEAAEPHLSRDDQAAWFDRLTAEIDDIRSALQHALESGDLATGLRLASAIWRLWLARSLPSEGRAWLQRLLESGEAPPELRAKGLGALAALAYWQADHHEAWERYEEALGIYRELGDAHGEASTLLALSTTATWMGDVDRGAHLADEALTAFEALGDEAQVGMVLMAQGFARWMQGDLTGARPLWERSLDIARHLGDHTEVATKRLALASLSFSQGERTEALDVAMSALQDLAELRNVSGMVMALDWVAAFLAHDDPRRAVRLAGAAETLRARLGGGIRPESVGLAPAPVTAARVLEEEVIEQLLQEGRVLGLEAAVGEALGVPYVLVLPTGR